MLEVRHLDFDYPDKRVLNNIHFTVEPGSILHLRGDNGAGKTTLLKIISGILSPTRGEIYYEKDLIRHYRPTYQQKIAYVGHKTGISQLLTVRENCNYELHHSLSKRSFNELIKIFSLEKLEDVPCNLLSVGQRRRVGLLRLLMSNASLWLLDEPLVALDNLTIISLMKVFKQHLDDGGLIVLTSHQKVPLGQERYKEYYL